MQMPRAIHAPLIKGCASYHLLGRATTSYPLGNGAEKQERSIPPFALESWQNVGVLGCCLRTPECLYQSFAVIWLFTERKDSLWHPWAPGLLLLSCLDVALFFARLRQWHWLCSLLYIPVYFSAGDDVCLVFWPVSSQRPTGNNGGRCCFYCFNHAFVFQVQLGTPSANQVCGWPSSSASPSVCCLWLAIDSWRLS